MRYRTLGKSNIRISEIGFGAWGIGGEWGRTDDDEATRAIQRAFDVGITFFDTALVYGNGHSEQLIGRALKDVRREVVIATKIPPKTGNWPVLPHEPITSTFPADWMVQCTENSLRNLGTDYVDLQQLHAWTPAYTQQLEWHEAFEKLRRQGKVRASGISANDWDPYGPVGLVRAGLIDSVQVIFNIFEQRPKEQLFPAAADRNTGIIARVPFEEGLLTGKMPPNYSFDPGDWRKDWLTSDRLAEAQEHVEALRGFLRPDRPTLAALALKYILSHPAVSTVIPGMRRISHVDENARVSDGQLLAPEEIESLKAHAFVHGWKYPWSQ